MAVSRNIVRDMFTSNGTVTLNGTTSVPVTSTVPIGPGSLIIMSLKTAAGTQTGHPYVFGTPVQGAANVATFAVKGTGAADTSVYNYIVIG